MKGEINYRGQSTNRLLNKRYCDGIERGAGYLETIVGLDCIYISSKLSSYTADEITNQIRDTLISMENENTGLEFYLNKINIEMDELNNTVSKIITYLVPIKAKNIPIYIIKDDADTPIAFVIGLTEDEITKFGTLLYKYRFQGIGIKIPSDDPERGILNYSLLKDAHIYLVVSNNRSKTKIADTNFDVEYMPTCYIVEDID